MTTRTVIVASVVTLLALISVRPAQAATCTIVGEVQIDVMDSYYCDKPSGGGPLTDAQCAGWKEVDLNTEPRRMRFMRIEVKNPANGSVVARGATDQSGDFTIAFDSSLLGSATCAGKSVNVVLHLLRVHENDINLASPRMRFAVTNLNGSLIHSFTKAMPTPLTGATTVYSHKFEDNHGVFERNASVYYTANSAITQMILWHADIDAYFSRLLAYPFFVKINGAAGSGGGSADAIGRSLTLGQEMYGRGDLMRHELGHIIHFIAHRGIPTGHCSSYRYGNDSSNMGIGQHGAYTCEWGYAATTEGMASFFGIRSLVTDETNPSVWSCGCFDPMVSNVCSAGVATMAADPDDAITDCLVGVGDAFAFNTLDTKCARVKRGNNNGCNTCNGIGCTSCPDLPTVGPPAQPADFICDNFVDLGFRNEINVLRWMWDMVDPHLEAGAAFDDTDRSVEGIIADLLASRCDTAGVDDDCDEPNPCSVGDRPCPDEERVCFPANDLYGSAPALATGTRDAYNAADMNQLFNSNSNVELTNNCLVGATD